MTTPKGYNEETVWKKYIVEGVRSIVGTPRSKTGKHVAEGLCMLLFGVVCFVGILIFAHMIGYFD
jgi:hypothetical protein